jgi:hypothetical protein
MDDDDAAADAANAAEAAALADAARRLLREARLFCNLDLVLRTPTNDEVEARRIEASTKRLLCHAAAEDRRWRATHAEGAADADGAASAGLSSATLLALAEQSLGTAVRQRCEAILPDANYGSRLPTPAEQHGGELCHVFKRARITQ